MEYLLNNKVYDVVIIKKKNKNTYIRIKEDYKIYVTTNYFASKSYIKKLLDCNNDALLKMIEQINKRNLKKDLFFYLGEIYDIIFVSNGSISIDYVNKLIKANNQKNLSKWLNENIKEIFNSHFSVIYNKFDEVKIRPQLKIRKMKSKWGVYNRVNHSITLNSELIKYNLRALDYVIVHELSHVIHFNHSKAFWSLVASYCQNYKEIKKELKE